MAIFALSYYDFSIHGEEYEKMKRERDYWTVGYVYIDSLSEGAFHASSRTDTVTAIDYQDALQDGRKLVLGDLISLKGKHIIGNTVSVDFIHFHDGRIWKVIISIIPVIILGFIFMKFFKYDKRMKRIVIK